ncbi:hypothetical protein [Lysinibacillus odysseyi]|uniref:Uncharacterized protein n=1 Tax=Lysinibacillus odysseyi 34hs-1 = NBRC 100172 TaxID=1220589 RepID=A0A0A3IIL8_9BACI|nr:hypothetical protein [Lysinibacillus odysseyi]KGR82668.1 hypothetical protein CD32_17575 [Lysinibacillus odysseyi 34hs-1 = NBRC 100172]
MGLYKNDDKHPRVFINNGQLVDNNQAEYKSDYLAEFVKEQQASNELLHRTIRMLKQNQTNVTVRHMNKWRVIDKQLGELNGQHEKVEQHIIGWLEKLEHQNEELQATVTVEQQEIKRLLEQMEHVGEVYAELEQKIGDITGINHQMTDRLDQHASVNEEMISRLDRYQDLQEEISQQLDQFTIVTNEVMNQLNQLGGSHQEVMSKMDEHHKLQQTMADQVSTIEETQKELVGQVEGQEGVMDKLTRQVNHLRSILYERTNFLEEKIEKAYEQFNQIYMKN